MAKLGSEERAVGTLGRTPAGLAGVGFWGFWGIWGLWAAAGALAQGPPVPLTGELPVNQFVTGEQSGVAVGMRADGVHVVVWQSEGRDPDGLAILQRKFPADGSAPFNESVLNQQTAANQFNPHIGMNAGGNFVAVWDTTASVQGIRGRASGNGGSTLGSEFAVSQATAANVQFPVAARADDDSFVAAWEHGDAAFRMFDATGTATGNDTEVAPLLNNPRRPSLGSTPSGGFVAAFSADDADVSGVYRQIFDATGAPLDIARNVAESPANVQEFPDIGVAADGSFVVTWTDAVLGLRVRCFSPAGVAVSAEVGVATGGIIGLPSVAVGPDGQFVVVYLAPEVEAREFDRTCRPVDAAFVVNTTTAGVQLGPEAAAGRDRYVAVWAGPGIDADGLGVARRLFLWRSIFADGFESAATAAWSATVP